MKEWRSKNDAAELDLRPGFIVIGVRWLAGAG
jgi:hypothetical protein